MKTKKLLWLTDNYPPQRGGMAQSCDRLVHGLRTKGFEIDILHFTESAGKNTLVRQQNGSYQPVPYEDSESHTLHRAWHLLGQYENTSAIVCFGGYLSMLSAPVYAKWLHIPLVTLIRGNDFDHALFTPRKKQLLAEALAQSYKVCTVTSDKQQKIQRLFDKKEVYFVPNGIDAEKWQPSVSEQDFAKNWREQHLQDKFCVGIFGQLKAKKGVKFLLESLSKTAIKERYHYLLVGEQTEEIADLLETQEIAFTRYDFLDRFELLKHYLCCDLLALPSFYDGMPNVLLEAGALGIPAIASRVDGMKDVIKDGINGLLFEPGNADQCRKAFYRFAQMSAEERQQMQQAIKTTIVQEYNLENELNAYERILDI